MGIFRTVILEDQGQWFGALSTAKDLLIQNWYETDLLLSKPTGSHRLDWGSEVGTLSGMSGLVLLLCQD